MYYKSGRKDLVTRFVSVMVANRMFLTENITKLGTLCLEAWKHVYNTSVVGNSA